MKNALRFLLPLLSVLAIVLVIYLYYFAPTVDELRGQSLVTDDPQGGSAFVEQTKAEYGDIAVVSAQKGNYYELALRSSDSVGGISVITKREASGHFQTIWYGQDYPDCKSLDEESVPPGIAGLCFAGEGDDLKVIDRSNLVRRIASHFFGS